MSKEEILRYIFSCVSYKHMFDSSPRITDSAQKKENLLFSSSVYFLRELCKNKNITVEDIKKESTMKEVTYKDWVKNPTPRMMWVWDSDEKNKKQRKVLYLSNINTTYPVIVLSHDGIDLIKYKHCAELEEPKIRQMTHKELAHWLREKPTREWKYKNGVTVYGYYGYEEKCENEEVPNNILIREDGGEWREPLVEE